MGGEVQSKTKTKNIHTIEPGSQQAHNQSDAQDKHTEHSEQGLYLPETSKCSDRQYLCSVLFDVFLKGI